MLASLWSTQIGDIAKVLVANNSNITATTDPTVSNDGTQGYVVGSIWINTSLNRVWECVGNNTGAAAWSFAGAAYGAGGSNPSIEVTQFGSGSGLMAEEGNIYRIPNAATTVPITPGGTGADYVVCVFTVPLNSFDVAGRCLQLTGNGSFATNTNTKRIKLFVGATTANVGSAITGGTAIADTTAVTTNGGGWEISATLVKYGAAGSNTQIGIHQPTIVGGTTSTLLAPQALTLTESSNIICAMTINNTTTATDALAYFFEVNVMN